MARILRLLWRGWLLLGSALGWINTRIILTIVFLVIVTPIAFARRVRGHGPSANWHERSISRDGEHERMRRLH